MNVGFALSGIHQHLILKSSAGHRVVVLCLLSNMNTLRSFVETTLWAQLGPLERQLFRAVWGRGTATVHEVKEDVTIWQTYTTIMTTMDRLFKKGLFDRTTDGRAFRYSARYSPKDLQTMTAANGMKQILESGHALLHLSYLVEAVGAHDVRLLDELQSMVERQRAQLGKREQP